MTHRFKFGDVVINSAASDRNPIKRGVFVRVVRKSHKNRYGITHNETLYELTDEKGHFWNVDPKFVNAEKEQSQ